MDRRHAGRLGRDVGVIGLGCWQLGADWGQVEESDALAVLGAAVDAGVTFLDTADVYGDGRSETLVGRFLKARGAGSGPGSVGAGSVGAGSVGAGSVGADSSVGAGSAGPITVATKMGRRVEQTPENYSRENFAA